MKLVLPNKKYKEEYEELVNSAISFGDASELGNAYREHESFNDLLKRLNKRRKGLLSTNDVAATVYFIIVDNHLIGTIDLRSYLNDSYFADLGHIAYYIKPEERRKGYATEALKLALKKYKNTNKILITCLEDNVASSKVIEKNGGILEKNYLSKRFNKNIKRYWITLKSQKNIIPKVVWLTINGTCNNKCNWCYARKYSEYNKIMDLNEIDNYIEVLKKNSVKKIILIGGEPTINPNIIQITKKIHNSGIKVSIASNGRLFSNYDFAKKMVDAGLNYVNISIKGASEKEYLNNTSEKGFTEMIQGYNNLKKLNIPVSLSYVLCDRDYSKFDSFWKMVEENNLNDILFQFYKPSVKDIDNNAMTIGELANLCKYVYDKIYKSDIKFHFEMSLPLCVLDENMLKHMIKKQRIYTCCHITKGDGLVFDPEFNILPCNHFVHTPLNDKKIIPDNIIDFWNSNTVNEFRNKLNHYPSEICSRCFKWPECGGGCILNWLFYIPDNVINEKYVYEMKGGV